MVSRHERLSIRDELDSLATNNLYRKLRTVEVLGPTARINGKEVVLLCSNDYLGLSRNKQVISSMVNSLKHGTSQCSSRLVAGNDAIIEKLERDLARHKGFERSLVYPTGYMANIGVIPSLAGKDDLIVSDEFNHASIVDACKMSKAEVSVFKHNDLTDLESKLSATGYRRKIVIVEGVFSMDGDLALLNEIGKITHENDGLLILDDAHGDFVYGTNHRGTAEHFGAEKYVDVLVSSMSKGLGCFGGYVASSGEIIEYLINRSRSFIYTSSLPSAIASGAITALRIARKGLLQKKLWKNVKRFRDGLMNAGFDVASSSHIIPVIVKDEKLALRFSDFLLEQGVFAQAIRYPTVPKSNARIRVSITAMLDKHIDDAIEAFRRSASKLEII
ncbi:MAG TPA: pyridoxal phosphate-dependent aminotransferase family protein [Nitrososphaerales archaeon]|nr:pyridoxal phosphate-dependent aminotransferase family protein [Nitrososphaerales archaeon]